MYGMVGSGSGGGVGPKYSIEKSVSRRPRMSVQQYRQASFTVGEKPFPPPFTRSNSSATVLHREGARSGEGRGHVIVRAQSTSEAEGRRQAPGAVTPFQASRRWNRSSRMTGKDSKTEESRELPLLKSKSVDDEVFDEDRYSEKSGRRCRSKHSQRHHSPYPFYRRLFFLIKQAWTGVKLGSEDVEEVITQEPRHRPEDINALCRTTHFTRTELQRFYRAFKDRCPTGVITGGIFKDMYCQMFPKGACVSQYAHYVFLTLDRQREGVINFEDLIALLSRLYRGSMADRLCWIFRLYDLNDDGYISREEMMEVVQAVYDLLGTEVTMPVDSETVEQKVQFLFEVYASNILKHPVKVGGQGKTVEVDETVYSKRKYNRGRNLPDADTPETFDTNKDDMISLDEFIDACSKDLTLVHNLDTMANCL